MCQDACNHVHMHVCTHDGMFFLRCTSTPKCLQMWKGRHISYGNTLVMVHIYANMSADVDVLQGRHRAARPLGVLGQLQDGLSYGNISVMATYYYGNILVMASNLPRRHAHPHAHTYTRTADRPSDEMPSPPSDSKMVYISYGNILVMATYWLWQHISYGTGTERSNAFAPF